MAPAYPTEPPTYTGVESLVPLAKRSWAFDNFPDFRENAVEVGFCRDAVVNEILGFGSHYDLLTSSMRMAIFQVQRESATAISVIMAAEYTEAQKWTFLADFDTAQDQIGDMGPDDTLVWGDEETARATCKSYARVCDQIKAAEAKHAVNLYNHNLRDVKIMYVGEGLSQQNLHEDKQIIFNNGGKPYHFWPYKWNGEPMAGMDVLIYAETLEKLFPLGRPGVEIKTNVFPRPPEPPGPASGVIWPQMTMPDPVPEPEEDDLYGPG